MPTVSATYAKQNFAEILDTAQREPVRIQRHDREAAVLLSVQEYEALRQLRARELLRLADEMGRQAQANGLTEETLRDILTES